MVKKKKKLSKKKQEQRKIKKFLAIFIVCLILFGWSFISTDKYNYVGFVLFPLWYVALALGVVAAIIYAWWFFKKIADSDKKLARNTIGMSLVVVFFTFIFFGALFAHVNHIFDPNEPERYVVTIEDKHYDGGASRRGIGHYEFRVMINDETEYIKVPRLHAYQFREGDLYVVEYHKGAFNEPYYIGVGAP